MVRLFNAPRSEGRSKVPAILMTGNAPNSLDFTDNSQLLLPLVVSCLAMIQEQLAASSRCRHGSRSTESRALEPLALTTLRAMGSVLQPPLSSSQSFRPAPSSVHS